MTTGTPDTSYLPTPETFTLLAVSVASRSYLRSLSVLQEMCQALLKLTFLLVRCLQEPGHDTDSRDLPIVNAIARVRLELGFSVRVCARLNAAEIFLTGAAAPDSPRARQ